ncbi:hypothetical protein DICPUDRAFT_157467 [Dictyostelium purpureum]|uniref:DDRGK domain-containing protein 1 n=1 Tax=Dictyostelium purpureum TaxID=5786 RepID=F0ZZ72_DICPU|nr:uncharacterized protein DICPUDRAFT_157467 [Dictyostelium purpureum]EGC30758.1 hypothetical protein DICPUDRAFT_157467 [Dictyostelium purpureum]|eukprot:XP_003292719.1 hypothetical protein DICPUDRAFT_157467 [Dictyostelium purpureum]
MNIIGSIVLSVLIIIIIKLLFNKIFKNNNETQENQTIVDNNNNNNINEIVNNNNNDNNNNNNNNRPGRGLGRMNIRNRRQQIEEPESSDSSDLSNSEDEEDEEDDIHNEANLNLANSQISKLKAGKKVGTKKLEKLRRKEEKKRAREYQEHTREEKKKNEEERDARAQKKKEEQKEIERLKKEEEEKLRLEQEKKEDEEYNLHKIDITLDETGEDNQDGNNDQSLLQKFIDYLKDHKICLLEDVAMEFNLKTSDVVERIKTLDKEGLISGVIDDRGKFIYITRDEMESAAKFINRKGRITIDSLTSFLSEIIDSTTETPKNETTNTTTTTA